MRNVTLFRLAATAAIVGGALRLAASFIPYGAGSAALETYYATTDLCLLFGLIGAYVSAAECLGVAGLIGFVVFAAGLASIVGPDPVAFGVDFYQLGVRIVSLGMLILSVQSLRVRRLVVPAVLWIGSVAAGAIGSALGEADPFLVAAGALFGAGFVAAGRDVIRSTSVRLGAV